PLQCSYLFSYLFTSTTPPPFEDRAYLTDLIRQEVKDKALVIRYGGQTQKGDHLYWAVGYKSPDKEVAVLQTEIEDQLIRECGLMIKALHFYKVFRYNLRFSGRAVQDGIPHHFDRIQGYKGIWYSGGLVSHWDISSIYEHNRWLVQKLRYQTSRKSIVDFFRYQFGALRSRLRLW
ncbi:MAG: hypothetical protein KDC44_05695, partial [Phaeodactylibacter sp.]|nr:hypothetical protein [Phaeodactylibacter sp.]